MASVIGKMRQCIDKYNLIEDGDKIAVGVSGGKDSMALITMLKEYSRYSPKKFEVMGIMIDIFDGTQDYSKTVEYMKKIGVELHIERTKVKEIVFDTRKEKNPCSLCANLRRGILSSKAKEFGCNKVALGHHSDDLIETFFLSMIFEGRLSTFAPNLYMTRSEISVIRPLLFVTEKEIKMYTKNIPIMFNCCEANHKTNREYMKELINNIEKDIPIARSRMLGALVHSERYNLLDNHARVLEKEKKGKED